ncbi:MAG: threonine--tRNA ligase [Polyangiaceae bacterium]
MINVRLPDGAIHTLADGARARDLAEALGPGLAKAAVAAKIDGEVHDLAWPLKEGAQVSLLTKRDAEALEVLRHSAAHLMADAILRRYPEAQLTIGPSIEDGFYYDIYMSKGGTITPEDFPALEEEMGRIAKEAYPFQRAEAKDDLSDEVFARYRAIDGGNNQFKNQIIEGIKARGEKLSFYRHGDFVDLCSGPHVPNTSWLKHVKLTKVSGAYWRGDPAREHLVRVYGTAFFSKADLDDYLKALEEAKKRDHRVLGERLSLFTWSDDAPGFPFFLPRGATLFNTLADYMRGQLRRRDYVEVKTPLIMSEKLWHTSGHYDNYLENMFFTKLKLRDREHPEHVHDNVEEERPMAVKPMNCPGHCIVFKSRLRSHNEFPLRICEMGLVHRREMSGVRHGLFRVQAFTQDDAHHFCTVDQIGGEVRLLIDFFKEIYAAFDLHDVRIELSTRPEKSIGSDEMWQKAESALKAALDEAGMGYQLNPGDGAFYGPKIDFHIRDVLKRSWQCGTIQLDFSMPERFGLQYVGADGEKHTPVMLHRASYGSLERFLGIIIENYAGNFPLWLAPVQIVVIPVSDKFVEYAEQLNKKLLDAGLRSEVDLSSDRVGYKIRQASLQRVPYLAVVGEREVASGELNIRSRERGELGAVSFDAFLEQIAIERHAPKQVAPPAAAE